jgi:hypothetical protein
VPGRPYPGSGARRIALASENAHAERGRGDAREFAADAPVADHTQGRATDLGRHEQGQRSRSGGQVFRACHSTMCGTRWARARMTVIAYSAIVAAWTPLVVVSGIAVSR